MTFLPVVQRELRAAARRRSTYRVRWWAVVIGLGLTLLSFLFVAATRGRSVGNPLFSMLTGYALLMCLLSGVFLTANALTEEKREGTLGLLFLTDLKGYDVVLGKFFAQSLNAFYCLMALLPVTALPILLGGVQGAEFWRMALALGNALFFSLAAGLSVSAFMRDSQRAMGNTLGLVLLLAAALPFLRQAASAVKVPALWYGIAWVSPFYPFSYASEMVYTRHASAYWGSLAASQLLSWFCLALASVALPRMVQEQRKARLPAWQVRIRNITHSRKSRAARLTANPVEWLRRDEMGLPWLAWLIVLASTVTVVLLLLLGGAKSPVFVGDATRPFGFLLKVIFAMHVCRFFVEARRNGALELLLCTPLSDRQIIRGQIKALWVTFGWPFGLFAAGLLAALTLRAVSGLWLQEPSVVAAAMGGAFLGALHIARFAADVFAILWFGMGMALTCRKPALAPALTIFFVLILPAPLSFCYIDILADLVFISWGTNKCRLNLRRLIAEQYQTQSTNPARP